MSAYTITITPDDAAGATTTLRLEASATGVRITDLHLHAAGGLRGGDVPSVDFELLLRAVDPTTATPIAARAAQTSSPEPSSVEQTWGGADAVAEEPDGAAQPQGASGAAGTPEHTLTTVDDAWGGDPEPEPATADGSGAEAAGEVEAAEGTGPGDRRRGRAGRRASSGATSGTRPRQPGKATRRAGGSRKGVKAAQKPAADPADGAAPATSGRGRKAKASAPAARAARAGSGGRAYRRMPADFASVYQQVGTASAVADHYQVPKHTAHGWIRRLRRAGRTAG